MYKKENARRNQWRRYQKVFYFVDNLHENVLRNVYSVDLNYGMEVKIQGRAEDNRANASKVEMGRLVQSACSSTKFVSLKWYYDQFFTS